MVSVGNLTIEGDFDTNDIDRGFDRVNNDFKELENQSNQGMTSLRKTSGVVSGLAKVLIGMGIAGVTAITALAVKSPILAGSMAKIELQTLKLSNTIGRQLKPVFESISGELIPALNQAFSNSSPIISGIVDLLEDMVSALSDLIKLDFESLGKKLEDVFTGPGTLKDMQEISKAKFEEFLESKETREKPDLGSIGTDIKEAALNTYDFFIDFFQKALTTTNDKDVVFSLSNGVTR